MVDLASIFSLVLIGANLILVSYNISIAKSNRKKIKAKERVEDEEQRVRDLDQVLSKSLWANSMLERLDNIDEKQSIHNNSLQNIQRRSLSDYISEVHYIHRMRNTKNSKWYNLDTRIRRFDEIEAFMDDDYDSYKHLGGNHGLSERYEDVKDIIRETRRESRS